MDTLVTPQDSRIDEPSILVRMTAAYIFREFQAKPWFATIESWGPGIRSKDAPKIYPPEVKNS